MNKLFLISCLTLSISGFVLGQGIPTPDSSLMQKLKDIVEKVTGSISQKCMADTSNEQTVCSNIMQDKVGKEVDKIAQEMAKANQGDRKKIAELGKKMFEPICCGMWQSKSCMIDAVKKCSKADQDNLAAVLKTATAELDGSVCKDYTSHSRVCGSSSSMISLNFTLFTILIISVLLVFTRNSFN